MNTQTVQDEVTALVRGFIQKNLPGKSPAESARTVGAYARIALLLEANPPGSHIRGMFGLNLLLAKTDDDGAGLAAFTDLFIKVEELPSVSNGDFACELLQQAASILEAEATTTVAS